MPTESDIARLREASEWVQQLNESNDQALADRWMEWCRSDPQNLPAFEQMQTLWNGFSAAQDARAQSDQAAPPRTHRNRLLLWAASILLLVAAAAWFARISPQTEVFETAVGEQRRVALADGSHLDLAPDSRVSARFTLAKRDLKLERGQAFFVVAHELLRPFTVDVNGLTVTAVGTAFDVRMGPSNTIVTVSEGRVRVAQGANDPILSDQTAGAGGNPEFVRAAAGQQVTFSKRVQRLSVASIDPALAGSWRNGMMRFVGEPLEDVASAINRYRIRKIVVAPAFQQTRFTGTVSSTNVVDWLKALEQLYSVEVVDQGVNGIQIQSRRENGTPR